MLDRKLFVRDSCVFAWDPVQARSFINFSSLGEFLDRIIVAVLNQTRLS